MPRVSVLLPTFNRPEGLLNAVNCFLNQRGIDDYELIISDNCSAVDPQPLLSRALKDSRVTYYRQSSNLGMAGNAEFLFSKVRGDYLILASDDDWWSEDFLATLIGLLDQELNVSFAMSNFCEVDESGARVNTNDRFVLLKKIFGKSVRYYPDHFPLLKVFDEESLDKRLINFIAQKEFLGKANIHRAICKSDLYINAYYDLKKKKLLGCWGFDQLLAFRLLVDSKLAVSEKLLFKCTVGNRKYYVDDRSKLVYLSGYKSIVDELQLNFKDKIYASLNNKFLDSESGFFQQYTSLMAEVRRISKNLPCDLEAIFAYHEKKDFLSAFSSLSSLVKESNDLYVLMKSVSNKKYIKYLND